MPAIFGRENPANDLIQLRARNELRDGKLSHRDDQCGLKEIHLSLQPFRAILDFRRIWNAITSRLLFAGETSAHRRHVDVRAKGRFIGAGKFIEPAKKLLPRRPGERTTQHRFFVPRCLSHQDDAADNSTAAHHGFEHSWATPTAQEARHMPVQVSLKISRIHWRKMRLGKP